MNRRPRRPLARLACLATLVAALAACDDDGTSAITPDADATSAPDATDTASPDTDTDEEVVDPSPGLGIDYDATAPGATPRFEPAAPDWLATGWPTDRLRDPDGHPIMDAFPDNGSDTVRTYLDLAEEVLDGFGLNGAVYFQLDADLDPATLPAIADTTAATSHIQLVGVTPGTRGYNRPLPLELRWHAGGADGYYAPRTLALRPVYGFVLDEAATYCAVLTRAVQDAEGRYLQQAPAFADALATAPDLAPLGAWLLTSPLRLDDIATATCFTTQDATGDLVRIAHWVDTLPTADVPTVATLIEPRAPGEFHGTYVAPNFQTGVKPYQTAGGDIVFDASGDPVVQEQETIRFLLLVPTDRPMPDAGWPLVLYGHGTTGDYESCRSLAPEMRADGQAVLCMDQPLHGIRGPNLNDTDLEIYSFNFINGRAGRSNFRQAAIDTLVQSRMVVEGRFDVPAGATLAGDAIRFDTGRVAFFGHSHGGLAGTLAIGLDPRLTGAVISGMAGVMTQTILLRKDPVDFAALVATIAGTTPANLDTFHPLLTLVQTIVDATDPVNYTRFWLDPPAGVPSKHVLVTSGTLDHASPYTGTVAAAAAGRVPLVLPIAKRSVAHDLLDLPPLDAPISGNQQAADGEARTVGLVQWQGGSHFVVFDIAEAEAIWRTFLETLAYSDDPPVIGPGDAIFSRPLAVAAADTCDLARAIDPAGLPVAVHGNTSLAGADYDADACDAEYAGGPLGAPSRDVAYTFRPATTGRYRLRLALPPAIDRDTPRYGPQALYVTTGCDATAAGVCVAHRSGAGALDVDLTADTDYTVIVDGRTEADKGPFTLSIDALCAVTACGDRECGDWGCGSCGTCDGGQVCADGQCQAAPAGDTCGDAIAVTSVPFADSGDTRGFLNDYSYGVGDCAGYPYALGAGSNDVAYRVTAPAAGTYTAELGAEYDGNLYVVGDCADVDATCHGALRTAATPGRVHFTLGAGESAHVIVDGTSNAGNSAGRYTLRVDTCEPRCDGRACGDDGCGGVCGTCDAGDTCVVEPSCEPFPLLCDATATCEDIPGNVCEAAFTVDALPYEDTQNTAQFLPEYGYGQGWCPGVNATWGFGSPDVAYDFTAPEAGLYHVALTTLSDFDANLYMVSDCGDIEGTCLAADERDEHERIWRDFTAGERAFIVVDGWANFSANTGRYTLKVDRCVPTCEGRACGSDGCNGSCGGCGALQACINHECAAAPGLDCDVPRVVGALPWKQASNTGSFDDRHYNACGEVPAGGGANDLTYRFKAPADGWFTFRVDASFDAQLYVTEACDLAVTTCLAGGGTRNDVQLVKDQTVFVIVDGAVGGVSGAFTLYAEATCFPQCEDKQCGADGCGGVCGVCGVPGDICSADAQCLDPAMVEGNSCGLPFDIGALPFEGAGDTTAAWNHYTFDAAGCGGDFTVKGQGSADQAWRFTAAEAGDYWFEVVPDGWDAVLYVVEDCADVGGTCLGADDGEPAAGERATVTLAAGAVVYVVVDGEDNVLDDAGAYTLRVSKR